MFLVPLVVNFGSCTWSPFMVNLTRIKKIQSRFANKATFLTVYVQGKKKWFGLNWMLHVILIKFNLEAHPVENEDFKNQFIEIKTHQNLKDRLEAASKEFQHSEWHYFIKLKMSCLSLRSSQVLSWLTTWKMKPQMPMELILRDFTSFLMGKLSIRYVDMNTLLNGLLCCVGRPWSHGLSSRGSQQLAGEIFCWQMI